MSDTRPTLLAVDDEPGVLAFLERFGRRHAFHVVSAESGRGALARAAQVHPDVVLVDLQMPGMSGLDVLRAMRQIDPGCPVALMTGYGSRDSEIEAVRLGALDYLTKPLDLTRLGELLTTAQKRLERRQALLKIDADVARQFEFYGMIGRGAAMQELFDSIRRLAPHVRRVLITGERGTGKDLVARALHAIGPRRAQRLVTVSCSAPGGPSIAQELFGQQGPPSSGSADAGRTGAFDHADGGTLFLDDVGELPRDLQPRVLRTLEHGRLQREGAAATRRVDIQVIAATSRDLRADADAGGFRSDLLHHLSTMEIHVPPLRDRREDIPLLTAAFLQDCATRLKRPLSALATSAERLLQRAPWEGNVRELRHVVERACVMTESKILSEREVLAAMAAGRRHRPAAPEAVSPQAEPARVRGDDRLSTVQRQQIDRVLQRVGGNKSEAARLLGISRRSLYRWIERFARETPGGDQT